MRSINPANGEVICEHSDHAEEYVEERLHEASSLYPEWRARALDERCEVLRAAAALLRGEMDTHATLMSQEMGKPITEARAEVEKCAWVCDFYAGKAAEILQPEVVETDAERSMIRFDPIGIVFGIMPWNFPYWQVFRYSAPTLAVGNVALLKHASNVPGCALAIEDVWRRAGLPPGGFSTLLISGARASRLVGREGIAAVTLTGSDAAGRQVAARAGEHLRKTVLELGGSDPFVVLGDADPEAVARSAVTARTLNSGQSCIAAKRFIVAESIADRFGAAMAAGMEALVVGDPLEPTTQIGPLARADLRDELHDQVERSVAAGAKILTGGEFLDGSGYFYAPTVLSDVEPGNPAFDEETFGPVAPIVRARDADHAVELANQSAFGLGASVWSADVEAATDLVPRIDAGSVFVNGVVKSDPRLPFGGVKDSGFGRELSAFGMREFVNVKTVWIG